MSFLNPAILAGLAAISIPIAIHLLNKFRVQETRWAATRFLAESLRENRSRLQLEDLLLLILRCLVVALLVFAFARPVLKILVPGSASGEGPVAAAILLDNSASMAQSDGVETRFEQGKKAIRESLDQLEPGSQVALFLVSDRTEAMIAKPGPDLPRFRRSLELAQVNERGSDLAQGVRAAVDALKTLAGYRREIRIYTDSQAPAWTRMAEIKKLQQENPGIGFKPIILGKTGEDNLAITLLKPEGGVPAANLPCRFRIDVQNFGSKPVESVRLTLAADGEPPSDETLIPRIDPGTTQSISLFLRFSQAGFHTVSAVIPPDRLPVDNQRTLALQVVDRMRVLLVEGSPQAQPVDRDSYFLSNALAPISADKQSQYYMDLAIQPVTALEKPALANYDVVFLCNPGAISPGAAQALKKYVTEGGNLVVFPGPKTDPAQWKQNAAFADLLPATMGPLKNPGNGGSIQSLKSEGFDHPVTAIWNDRAEGTLGSVRFNEYFPLELKKEAPASAGGAGAPPAEERKPLVLFRFGNDAPAAVDWGYGNGRVVEFSSTATPQWNNLPLHPGFVALTQRLMGYLSRRNAARLVLGPGESFEMPVSMELLGKDFSVIRPGPDKEKRAAGRVDLDGGRAVIRYRDTENVGPYRVFIGQEDHPLAVFAVEMDPEESDLRQEEAAKIEVLEKGAEAGPAGSANPGLPQMRVSREFWTLLVWIAAFLALAETVLAHRFSRPR